MLLKRAVPAVVVLLLTGAGLAVVASPAVADPPAVQSALPPGGSFMPVTPARVLDTRAAGGPVTAVTVQVGPGLPGVDLSGVAAVLLNVTVVNASGAGYVTVGGGSGTSNGNYIAGAASATLALVRVGSGGTVAVSTSARANVVVDVQGYVTTPEAATDASFTPVAPVRVADSRTRQGLVPFVGASTQTLAVRSRAGIPADATAVIANVTIAGATTSTYITAWGGGARPAVSTVNAGAGQIVANRALIPLGSDGDATFANAGGTTNVVVDVVGYLAPDPTGSFYTPVTPGRIEDKAATSLLLYPTDDTGAGGSAIRAPSAHDLAPTTAAWLTLVGDHPSGRGYVAAAPDTNASAPPGTSDLNLVPGRAVANAGPVAVGAQGAVQVFSVPGSRIVADLSGWFQQVPRPPAAATVWTTTTFPDYSDPPTRRDVRPDGPPAYFAAGVFAGQAARTPTRAFAIAPDTTVRQTVHGSSTPGGVASWGLVSQVGTLSGITQLASAGDSTTAAVYALDGLGRLYGFQSNRSGELGTTPSPLITYPLSPTRVPVPTLAVTAVYAAQGIGYAVGVDGTVYSWGRSGTGQLGRTATSTPWTPAPIPGLTSPAAIAGDGQVTFAIDAGGATLQWGTPVGGTLQAAPTASTVACPTATSLHADFNGVWELCSDGTVVQLSRLGAVPTSTQTLQVSGVTALGAGAGYDNGIRVLLDDGRVADVPSAGPARYEAGFAGVIAINGSPGAQITSVGGAN